jgi:hypothetical protein
MFILNVAPGAWTSPSVTGRKAVAAATGAGSAFTAGEVTGGGRRQGRGFKATLGVLTFGLPLNSFVLGRPFHYHADAVNATDRSTFLGENGHGSRQSFFPREAALSVSHPLRGVT